MSRRAADTNQQNLFDHYKPQVTKLDSSIYFGGHKLLEFHWGKNITNPFSNPLRLKERR